jgi:hypothetical protein
MDLVSSLNTILFHGKHRNNEAYRICQGVFLHYFGLMGYVSSWAQQGRVLGLEHDPNTHLVVLHPLIYLHSHHKQIGFCFIVGLAAATSL